MDIDIHAGDDADRARLERLGLLNDDLSEVVDRETEREADAFRAAEGIHPQTPGERTNMDELADMEADLGKDIGERNRVRHLIHAAEAEDPVAADSVEHVSDALVRRTGELRRRFDECRVDYWIDELALAHDVAFLR